MDIILTLLALFPSLMHAGAQGGSTSASMDNSEIRQIMIQDNTNFKFNDELEYNSQIFGLV